MFSYYGDLIFFDFEIVALDDVLVVEDGENLGLAHELGVVFWSGLGFFHGIDIVALELFDSVGRDVVLVGRNFFEDLVFLAEFVVVLGSHWVCGCSTSGSVCGRLSFIF
jgi:hypothetical protein